MEFSFYIQEYVSDMDIYDSEWKNGIYDSDMDIYDSVTFCVCQQLYLFIYLFLTKSSYVAWDDSELLGSIDPPALVFE